MLAGEAVEGQRLVNQFRVLSRVDPSQVDQTESRWSGDVDGQSLSVRCTFVSTVLGDKLCIRLLGSVLVDASLPSLVTREKDLLAVRSWLDSPTGMMVVAGPTGSGKSTLMYSVAEELSTPQSSVVTLEDPVERQSTNMTQLKIGSTASDMELANAVKVSLRLDPDYLTPTDLQRIREGVAAEEIVPNSDEFISVGVQAVREGITSMAEMRRIALPYHP